MFFTSTLAVLAAATVAQAQTGASVDYVGSCADYSYADGGIYCRKTSPQGGCRSDLGDFPTKVKFPANWGIESNTTAFGITNAIQLARGNGSPGTAYTVYDDVVIFNATKGAYGPVIVKNPTAMAEGEVHGWFDGGYGVYQWVREPAHWSVRHGTGFTLVDVPGYPLLSQLYWDQNLYDRIASGEQWSGDVGFQCYGNYNAAIAYQQHP